MKKILFILLFLLSSSVLATVGMHIDLANSTIKQGKVEQATLRLDEGAAQQILAKKITGLNLENTIYLLEVGPLSKKNDGYEANAKVIFLKVPESKVLQYQGSKFPITWSPVEIIPTEASQNLIFEQFTIPTPKNILLWISLIILTLLIFFAVMRFRRIQQAKALQRKRRISLRDELMKGTQYSEVVDIWKKRDLFLAEFPEIQQHFKMFEQVLFKYQFKPFQTETEKIEIMQAYREFINNIRGGLNGI